MCSNAFTIHERRVILVGWLRVYRTALIIYIVGREETNVFCGRKMLACRSLARSFRAPPGRYLPSHSPRAIVTPTKNISFAYVRPAVHRRVLYTPRSTEEARENAEPTPTEAHGLSPSPHSPLHDFCLTLPYAGILTLIGILSHLTGSSGSPLVGLGLLSLALSVASLTRWKRGEPSTLYTLSQAVLGGVISYGMWLRCQLGRSVWVSQSVLVLSVAITAFCLLNVVAGGNPPKKAKEKEKEKENSFVGGSAGP